MAWVNQKGGVNNTKVNVDTVDYGYQVPRAVSQYKKWVGDKVAAIMGWGTADTEALTGFVAQDQIPFISASYAAALTDPTGQSNKAKPAPYNFFYGPSYSDALRGDAHLGGAGLEAARASPASRNSSTWGRTIPIRTRPKEAGEAIAKELGFEVLPPVQFALTPGDYTAQCLTVKNSGANYAYLGNTAGSNISVLKACKTAGTDVQFLGNVWGMDENAAKAAGDAADGVVFPLRTAATWNGDAPGMATLREISKLSDPIGHRVSAGALCGRRLHRALPEGGDGLGRAQRRRHRPERQEGLLSEEGLGAGRHGRRLRAVDLDRDRPPFDADREPLSHEGLGSRPTRRSTI